MAHRLWQPLPASPPAVRLRSGDVREARGLRRLPASDGDTECGMTGARIITTLLNGLQTTYKTFGLETMCVAGGQGMAMIIERLS